MIQRVQSIFLALAGIVMLAFVFSTVWKKENKETNQLAELKAYQMVYTEKDNTKNTNTFYIAGLALLSSALAFGSLFSYSSRFKQIKINLLNTLVIVTVIGLSLYFVFEGEKLILNPVQGNFGMGFFLPMSALIFNSIANRFIRRDEQMVRSMDRLR